jgi:hypothetical protein
MNGHTPPALIPAAWLVLVATVLAYLTGVISVGYLSPPIAGVVANLEAVVATVLAWVLLGEHLGLPQVAGGLLVLAGAFAAQISKPAAVETGTAGRSDGATEVVAGATAPGSAASGAAPSGSTASRAVGTAQEGRERVAAAERGVSGRSSRTSRSD